MLSIALILSIFIFVIPIHTTHYGWVEITDKKIENDNYHLYADLGSLAIDIKTDEKDSFVYEAILQESEEVSINKIWGLIKPDNKYFVRIKTNIFKSTYRLEKIYGY